MKHFYLLLTTILATCAFTSASAAEYADSWEDAGVSKYYDKVFNSFGYPEWTATGIPTQVNTENSQLYRFNDIYLNNPYSETYPCTAGASWVIDTSNPDRVAAEVFETGLYVPDMGYAIIVPAWIRWTEAGFDESSLTESEYGKLVDGTITWPEMSLFIKFSEDANETLYTLQETKLLLPGATDYRATVSCDDACSDASSFNLNIELSDDIAEAKLAIWGGDWPANDDWFNYLAYSYPAAVSFTQSEVYNYAPQLSAHSLMTAMLAGINADGDVVAGDRQLLFFNPDESANWTNIGKATFTDDIYASLYQVTPSTYEVDVEENNSKPGYYRIVNPYTGNFPDVNQNTHPQDHNHYIYINACNPEQVYIEESPVGFSTTDGPMFVNSMAYMLLSNSYSADDVTSLGAWGQLVDGVITFPRSQLLVCELNYVNGTFFNANLNTAFSLTLPDNSALQSVADDATLAIHANNGAISVSGANNKPVLIHSVDGKQIYGGVGDVNVPLPSGLYIVTVGSHSTKLSVR